MKPLKHRIEASRQQVRWVAVRVALVLATIAVTVLVSPETAHADWWGDVRTHVNPHGGLKPNETSSLMKL